MRLSLFTVLLILLSAPSFAKSTRSKIAANGPRDASLTITNTNSNDSVQAAAYADGAEVSEFVQLMFANSKSPLAKLKLQMEKENCDEYGQPDAFCGKVVVGSPALITFSRGGWAYADASYVVFMGYRQMGSGQDIEMSKALIITEMVESLSNDNDEPSGKVTKQFALKEIQDFKP